MAYKKIQKIMPLYVVSIFFYLFLLGNGGRFWLGSIESVSALNVLSHLLLVNGFCPYFINSIQGIEWYLADLVIFYLITPILFKYITSLKNAIILLIFSNVFSVMVSSVLGSFCPIVDQYIWTSYVYNFAFFSQFPVWVLGIALFFLVNRNIKKNNVISLFLFVSAIVLMIVLVFEVKFPFVSQWLLWGIAIELFILSNKFSQYSFAKNRFIEYIGKISYPIYLFHYLCIDLWDRYIGVIGTNIVNMGIKYICVIAISVLIAKLSLQFMIWKDSLMQKYKENQKCR